MMRILSVLRNVFIKSEPLGTPLGRWQIEKCNIRLNHKIALSNEDHCGPCGEYKTKDTVKIVDNINIKSISKNIILNPKN